MRKVLILAGRYLPGYKDGGPIRTLVNLTELLGDEYDFRLTVLDRDHGDTVPYSNIKHNAWNIVGKAKVFYVEPGSYTFKLLRKLSKNVDVIYLCSFFDSYGYKTLILNRLNLLYRKKIVVAPMGVFSQGAISQKKTKKKLFIKLCKVLGLFKDIIWSVTSELEKKDVFREIGLNSNCIIAEDLPRMSINITHKQYSDVNHVKLVFISRISPKKNLLFAIELLSYIKKDVVFDIYGPLEDLKYWEICLAKLRGEL